MSAQDHRHLFGNKAPLNASGEIEKRIRSLKIESVQVRKTGNIFISFSTGVLKLICTSAGHEAYQINVPDNLIIVSRGENNGRTNRRSGRHVFQIASS